MFMKIQNRLFNLFFTMLLLLGFPLLLSLPTKAANSTATIRIPELDATLTVKAYISTIDKSTFQVSADYKSNSSEQKRKTPKWIKVAWSFEATRINLAFSLAGVTINSANSQLSSKGGSWENGNNTHSSHRGKIIAPAGVAKIRITAKASFLCDGVCRSVETSAEV